MRKKLIEVSLPLDAINDASQAEKYNPFLDDHPRRMHIYFARRPLAACRAVLFSSLVDDPDDPEAPKSYIEALENLPGEGECRDKLFRFIGQLVKWDSNSDLAIIGKAKELIRLCSDESPPPVIDPFCGGGSIPIEAQRLGLKCYASDLNPVAVLITKATVELSSPFIGLPPVNPDSQPRNELDGRAWTGARGLAADIRYYGERLRAEAARRIGNLYPRGPSDEPVIAWLWARSVTCLNPACRAEIPLLRSLNLSTKKRSAAHLRLGSGPQGKVLIEVRQGKCGDSRGTVTGSSVICPVCGEKNSLNQIRQLVSGDVAQYMSHLPLACVIESEGGRRFVESTATMPTPNGPDSLDAIPLPEQLTGGAVMAWGFKTFRELFTDRQRVMISVIGEILPDIRDMVKRDAIGVGKGAAEADAYADAIFTYLTLARSRATEFHNSLVSWNVSGNNLRQVFNRQALPMVWDFAEANPISGPWSLTTYVEYVASAVESLPCLPQAVVRQGDAANGGMPTAPGWLVATDPPYYDNMGYADLCDFFYGWLRQPMRSIYPDLFSTIQTPKEQELVVAPYRFGGDRGKAESHFEHGMTRTFGKLRQVASGDFPMTIYYALKEAEDPSSSTSGEQSTGWAKMLQALLNAGLHLVGTWPLKTERPTGNKQDVNALASSVVLVCRPRAEDAPLTTRRQFEAALRQELPNALRQLTHGGIAPVDLAQASIGPGMAIFSRYSKVLEADGNPVTVRTALQIINQELDRYLAEQETEFDRETRFCIDWFTQFGQSEGAFGDADVLARAKNTSVDGLVSAGVLEARRGKVRVLGKGELKEDWKPSEDSRVTVWECAHHLIRRLDTGGEAAAAALAAELGGGVSENARALAYRLYSICDRKGWSDLARDYNNLVVSWPAIRDRAAAGAPPETGRLL